MSIKSEFNGYLQVGHANFTPIQFCNTLCMKLMFAWSYHNFSFDMI